LGESSVNGKFVVFEGGEGCGKTTQLKRLEAWFEQKIEQQPDFPFSALKSTREPGGSQLCQKIRQVLLTPDRDEEMQNRTELLLYAADRAQHVDAWLRPWLNEGALVLCDRYTASTVAYQGYGRGLDRRLIETLNQIATGGLEPDLTLWLDLDPEIGLARAQARGTRDRIEQADLKFHQNVRSGFAALHDAQNKANPDRFIRIDASQSMDLVEQDLIQAIERVLPDWLSV
jgi:dTMP kinase